MECVITIGMSRYLVGFIRNNMESSENQDVKIKNGCCLNVLRGGWQRWNLGPIYFSKMIVIILDTSHKRINIEIGIT